MTEARIRVRFHGLFGAVLPRCATDPAHLLLVDVRRGIQPLGLSSEKPVPPHVGVIEFRGPVVVNDVELPGGGYLGLGGHDVTILPGMHDDFDDNEVELRIDVEDSIQLPGAIDMAHVVGPTRARIDSSLLDDPEPKGRLTGRVKLLQGHLRAGDLSSTRWDLRNPLSPRAPDCTQPARELWLETDTGTPGLSLQAKPWNGHRTKQFRIEPLAHQNVDVIVSNVCGVLPSTCMVDDTEMEDDEDFRALYELLAPEAQDNIRQALASGVIEHLPYPRALPANFRPLPCYYAWFTDPR